MKRRTRTLVLILVAVVAGVALAVESVETRAVSDAPPQAMRGDLDRGAVQSFTRFALYSLGDSFEGLPLVAQTRRDEAVAAGERLPANYVGFVYGECLARDEMGCAPPLEVQIWPACVRSLADYSLTPAGQPLPHEPAFVRGVPAAVFEEGFRLELYTGDVTVIVFGLDRAQIERAARALRGANALASQAPVLPPPVAGAMAGTLRCR